MNVLEVSLQDVSFVDRTHASGIINRVDDLDCQSNPVCGSEAQDRALLLRGDAGGRYLGPEFADRLRQKSPSGSKISFGAPDGGLNHRLITEHRLHSPRCLGVSQLEERADA